MTLDSGNFPHRQIAVGGTTFPSYQMTLFVIVCRAHQNNSQQPNDQNSADEHNKGLEIQSRPQQPRTEIQGRSQQPRYRPGRSRQTGRKQIKAIRNKPKRYQDTSRRPEGKAPRKIPKQEPEFKSKQVKCKQKPQHNRSWRTRADHDDQNENQDSRSQAPIGTHIKTKPQSGAHQNKSQQPRNNKGSSNREDQNKTDRSNQRADRCTPKQIVIFKRRIKADYNNHKTEHSKSMQIAMRLHHLKSTLPQKYNSRI